MKVLSNILVKAGILKDTISTYGSGGYDVLVRNQATGNFEAVSPSAFTPDLQAYATLSTSQTISGTKTFSGGAQYTLAGGVIGFAGGIAVDKGVALTKGSSAATLTPGAVVISSALGDSNVIFSDSTSANKFQFNNSNQTYTFPAASGTVALTSDLVPGTLNFTGDVTGSGNTGASVALTLASSGATAGTYGSSTNIPVLTVDAKGRITSVSNTAVNIVSQLSGLSDVTLTSVANNQLLKYNSTSTKWENWTPNYLTAEADTLATVTGRGATTTSSITALSFIKSSGTASQFLKADGTVDSSTYLTAGTVLTTPITGYAVGSNTALAATDTILGAFNKIQAQLNNKQASGTYLTSYTETSTLANVTARGATTNASITVNGYLTIVGAVSSSSIYMNDSDNGQREIHCNSDRIGFLTQGGAWGSYCNDDGSWVSIGDITAYSDSRIKENVVTVENALDKILKLRGVFYNRTDIADKSTKLGVIAQEVQKVLPEIVHEEIDGLLGVSYGNMAGLFIEAFKEQQQEIKAQAIEINQLKVIINGLTR